MSDSRAPRRHRAAPVALLAALLAPAALTAAPAASAQPAPAVSAAAPGPAGTYLVRAAAGSLAGAAAAVRTAGGEVRETLTPLDTLVAVLPAGADVRLRQHGGVEAVTPDAPVRLLDSGHDGEPADRTSMHALRSALGVHDAWSLAGTGAGVDVALIDSGVARVPGLDAPGKVLDGPDLSYESQTRRHEDTFGHGTHMAGIIAGRDAGVSAGSYDPRTSYLGVAPEARLLSVRVAGASGATDVSQVIAAISWVVEHARDGGRNVRVLNLSFGTDSTQPYVYDPLAHAAEVAWRSGIVVVTSAGNGGTAAGRLTNPAIDPYVLAVGADDTRGTARTDDDQVPAFSAAGDGRRNPDLVAPGVSVQSLLAPGSTVAQHGAAGQSGRYQRGSGTSQAAAVVSGAAAVLLSGRPGLTPDQVKALLVSSARPVPGATPQRQGAGLLNLKTAAGAKTPTSVQAWPTSHGRGSLDAARGTRHVVDGQQTLRGELDVFGRPYDAALMARTITDRTSWRGETWNGSTWAGSTWAGSTWAGSTWAGSTWAGSTWAGSTWAGSTWAGSTWAGSTWD